MQPSDPNERCLARPRPNAPLRLTVEAEQQMLARLEGRRLQARATDGKRRRWLVLAGAGLLGALIVALIVALLLQDTRLPPPQAKPALAVLTTPVPAPAPESVPAPVPTPAPGAEAEVPVTVPAPPPPARRAGKVKHRPLAKGKTGTRHAALKVKKAPQARQIVAPDNDVLLISAILSHLNRAEAARAPKIPCTGEEIACLNKSPADR